MQQGLAQKQGVSGCTSEQSATYSFPAGIHDLWKHVTLFVASFVVAIAFSLAAPSRALADARSMSTVAPCLFRECRAELAKCVLNPNCAANLTCILGCTGDKDESSCQIKCGDLFENDVVGEFNACALSGKKCIPQRPATGPMPGVANWTAIKGQYPVPGPEALTKEFDPSKMTGPWYISAGLNPLFDRFDCQLHFFLGTKGVLSEPGKLLGKINWRIQEPDGEFLTKSTVQKFIQTSPAVLENHDNEYLHYKDDWYILDHDYENDPKRGFVLIYYVGSNDAWANYGGGTLYTRSKTVPPEIVQRVQAATEKIKIPFDKYWRLTDNSCKKADDPSKLQAQYAQKLLAQGKLTAEEQLTYLARSAYSGDNNQRDVQQGALKLEKMTEDWVRSQATDLAKFGTGVEIDLEKAFRSLFKDSAPKYGASASRS